MPDYKKLYFMLFAAAADAVEYLEQEEPERARLRLIRAQQAAEEQYLAGEQSAGLTDTTPCISP